MFFFFKVLFLNMLFLEFIKCVIKFNFKKKFSLNEVGKTINYIDYIYKNDLYTELLIGNPSQIIPMTIKYDQEPFYLATPFSNGIFNHNISNTFYSNFSEINYPNDERKKGYISSEKIILNSQNNKIEISNIFFFYLTQPKTPIIDIASLGLSFMKKSIYNNLNFLIQLKQKNLIDNYGYSYYFINENEGNVFIGNYPHEYNHSFYDFFDFFHLHIASSFDYTGIFDKIFYGDNLMNAVGTFYINNTLGGIIGNYFIEKLIEYDFFLQYIENKKCEKKLNDGFLYYECDHDINISNFKNLSFYSQEINFTFVLTYEDLFHKNNEKIYSKIVYRRTMLPIFILGQPFLKKYFFVFDQNKKIMGFYKKFKEKKYFISLSFLLIIILLFFSIILIIILIRKIMKNPKRVKANELEENNDYLMQIDF